MKAAFFRVQVARGGASMTDAGRSWDLEMAWSRLGDWLA